MRFIPSIVLALRFLHQADSEIDKMQEIASEIFLSYPANSLHGSVEISFGTISRASAQYSIYMVRRH